MKREIKYKFWLGHTKKMTYPHTLKEIHKIIPDFTSDIIPLQFIGKKNKNGDDLYEGDLLKGSLPYENSNEYPIMVVRWNETECGFDLIQVNGGKYWCPISWATDTEIIGNIYENPKILTTHP